MAHYAVEPEVAGQLGPGTEIDPSTHPPRVTRLEYTFDGWLGDGLVESFPCFIARAELAQAIRSLGLTGAAFAPVEVTRSDTFAELYPDRQLQKWEWLQPGGVAGVDDFGIGHDHRLVVSDTALAVLQNFGLNEALVDPLV